MLKRSSLFVGIIAFLMIIAMSAPGAIAKKKVNFFEVSKFKIDGEAVSLSKPKAKKSNAGDITESVADTRPKIVLLFKKLRNKKGKSTINMKLGFTPVDTNDQRRIIMNVKLIVKVDKKGKKITKSTIKGSKFTYEGTLPDGSPAIGGTLDVDKSALSAKGKKCTLNSEVLLSALTAEDKIGQIGKQAGDYNYTLTLTGPTFKLKKKPFKKIKGLITVTE